MKVVYKYVVPKNNYGEFSFEIPGFEKVVKFDVLNDELCIWAEVNTIGKVKKANFKIYGTGHMVGEEIFQGIGFEYCGTCFEKIEGRTFVWHLYIDYNIERRTALEVENESKL